MTIREKYAVTGAQPVASYDWVDLTSGVGYKRYYGCASDLLAATAYFLTTTARDSIPIKKTSGAVPTTSTLTKMIDLDFDLEFLRPAIIDGVAIVNLTFATRFETVSSSPNGPYAYVDVKHVSTAPAETSIGTGQTEDKSGTINTYYRSCIKVPLTRKHFSIGEKLRLTVEVWAHDTTGGTAKMVLWHDPNSAATVTDEDGITRNTDLILDIPFRIAI